MTATLEETALDAGPDVPDEAWRDRLRPLVDGTGGWLVTLLVTLVAGVLRFVRLSQPATTLTDKGVVQGPGDIFDEVYYACDSHSLVTHGVERATQQGGDFCTLTDAPAFVVHPPLGKWLIGLGERAFGFDTFGWRFAAMLFGTLTVLLVVRIGRRMTGSTALGGLAGLLLALDGLHFVQSRVAMLDVFLVFFLVATFAALLVDRDAVRSRLAAARDVTSTRLGWRPWRLVAGTMAGCAVATKWSALFSLAVMVLLAVAWEAGAWRTAGVEHPRRWALRRTAPGLLLAFAALPLAVYLVSWTGWFVTDDGWSRQWAATRDASALGALFPDALRSWWHYHWEIYHFHATLDSSHPYQSHPLSWPFLGRPVSYYYPPNIRTGTYGCSADTCSREVLAIGTPALWWAMVPVCLGLLARWVSKRDWRASSLLLLTAVPVLAWIPSDLKDRTMFLFYALPAIPFLCLGIALLAGWLLGRAGTLRRTLSAAGIGVYTSLVLVNFAYLYPVLAAVTVPYADWYSRMWFRSWI